MFVLAEDLPGQPREAMVLVIVMRELYVFKRVASPTACTWLDTVRVVFWAGIGVSRVLQIDRAPIYLDMPLANEARQHGEVIHISQGYYDVTYVGV